MKLDLANEKKSPNFTFSFFHFLFVLSFPRYLASLLAGIIFLFFEVGVRLGGSGRESLGKQTRVWYLRQHGNGGGREKNNKKEDWER